MVGSFDSSGSPTIEIEISGWKPGTKRHVTAVVDTGFTGFLLLPILIAFPVGLILHSMIDITLADGSTQNKLTCLGSIHFAGQMQTDVIVLEEQSTEVLVGMDFLKAFKLTLIIDAAVQKIQLVQEQR